MDRLEQLVRDAFDAHAQQAPDGSGLLDSLQARTPTRRFQWALVAAAAAVVVGLIVGLAVALPGAKQTTKPLISPAPKPSPAIPSGMQAVSYHGLQFFVPATWQFNQIRCDTPMQDTVIWLDVPVASCLYGQRPTGITAVYLASVEGPIGHRWTQFATRVVQISGHMARTGRMTTGAFPGSPLSVLIVSDVGAAIGVVSDSAEAADRIFATVRVGSVDVFGCQTHVSSLKPTVDNRAVGGISPLVAVNAVDASVCRYSDYWLDRATALSPTQTAQLTQILNALPAGVSQPGGFGETHTRCLEDERRGFIVHFRYAGGASGDDVYVHVGGCGSLSASNGRRTAKVNQQLARFLLQAAGYDSGGLPETYR